MFTQGIDRFVLGLGVSLLLGLSACAPKAQTELNGGLLTTDDLGETASIFGGEAVADGDAVLASTVAIVNLRYGQVVCSGSLVAKNMVVTAGHCTAENPSDLAILFTNKIPKTRQEARVSAVRKVIAGKTHPQWPKNDFRSEHNWGDIALLRFEGALPAGYKPIRLLSKKTLLVPQGDAVLAGFGWTNGRKKTAAEGLNKTKVKIEKPDFSDMEIMFNQKAGSGACHGDSGGPAFIEVESKLVLVGVTSRGHDDPNDTCESYSLYSSIPAQIEWLKTTAIDLQKAEAIGQKMPQPY
jgi:hypothetical protein